MDPLTGIRALAQPYKLGSSHHLSCVIAIGATQHRCGDAVLLVRNEAVPLSKELMIPKHSQLLFSHTHQTLML